MINDQERGPAEPPAAGDESDSASLQAQLEEERGRAQSYLASWQRTQADFQNYKRRTEDERANERALYNRTLVLNMLPALDDLERGLAALDAETATQGWVEGMRQVQRKFVGALAASGVQPIEAEDQIFDPHLHEAVGQLDGPADTVVRVLQRGYLIGDRVLRPAMVMVGNGVQPSGSAEPAATDADSE